MLLLLLAILICGWFARHAYALLACEQPVPGATTLVVEDWLDPGELAQVVEALRSGHYQRVITTGYPLERWEGLADSRSAARRAADFLRASPGVELPVIAVETPHTPRDRTYTSAVTVRDWARTSGVRLTSLDVFSAGVHARRSRLMYRLAFGDEAQVGVLAARPVLYDGPRWWTNSEGAKRTVGEVLSLAWTECCFWP